MKLRGPYQPTRQLAVGKTIYVKMLRGQLIACKWPRRRPRVTHPTTLAQMEKFRQANWLTKFAPAAVQMTHRKIVAGTQLLPRDLMIAAMYGRGLTWQINDHRRRYPVAAVQDLSDTLDLLGTLPGDIIARGPDGWRVSSPTQPGQVPMSQAAGLAPVWQTLTGGVGIWQGVEDVTLAVPLALNAYHSVAIPPTTQREVEFTVFIPTTASGVAPACRLNGSAAANYFIQQQGMLNANVLTVFAQNQTQWRLNHSSMGNLTGKHWIRGRVFQDTAGENVGLWADYESGGNAMLQVKGAWVFAGAQPLAAISFGSMGGQGLPAGTRIIVRMTNP